MADCSGQRMVEVELQLWDKSGGIKFVMNSPFSLLLVTLCQL